MKFVKIENNPGLVRNLENNSIINVDDVAYSNYKTQKQMNQLKLEKERLRDERINKLESDINTLKDGVTKILEILNNAKS